MLFSPAASSLASSPGGNLDVASASRPSNNTSTSLRRNNRKLNSSANKIELEVNWDPNLVKNELLQATAILSHRGLKLAAKWAAEQMVGIQAATTTTPASTSTPKLSELDCYAKTLMDAGEYLHAASVLSEPSPPSSSTGYPFVVSTPPRSDATSYGTYLRAYCLYLAGERRKQEEQLQLESEKQKASRNPYLQLLLDELCYTYDNHNHKLDPFGLYVYGMILKEAQKESMTCPHAPHIILIQSILKFPYNWSAWLDLCQVIIKHDTTLVEQQVEQALQPTLASHYMYHFFCAHLMANHHQAHEDALVLYERLYEPAPTTPTPLLFQSTYLKAQMGVVHYHLREFEQALQWFSQIQDSLSLEHKDVFSNILYVKEDRVALSQLAHQAVQIDKYRPETCCIIGNYYSLKQQRQKAVLYFQRALQLDRNYTSAWTLMGHEYVELKQTERAMEAYRRAVQLSPKDYRAWYGLGQTYEFLNMNLYSLFYHRKAATLRPYDARMWCAVGLSLVALRQWPDAIRAYERAVAQEDTEGVATQKLATLYRQTGRTEEAAQSYLRHLELRFWVTHPMQHQQQASTPLSLDTIVQGVAVEAPEAEALLFLAHYHQANGEFDTAALFCSRLVDYPGPEKEQAKGLLRDLRSRSGAARAAGTRGGTYYYQGWGSKPRAPDVRPSEGGGDEDVAAPTSADAASPSGNVFEFSP